MIGKVLAVLLLFSPLAVSIYFLFKRKKVRFPWFLTGLLILVAFMSLIAIGLFIYTLITFKH
jgi:hypothetical protein